MSVCDSSPSRSPIPGLWGRQEEKALLSHPPIPLPPLPNSVPRKDVTCSNSRKDVTDDDENVSAAAAAPESGCSQGWHHEVMGFRGQGQARPRSREGLGGPEGVGNPSGRQETRVYVS